MLTLRFGRQKSGKMGFRMEWGSGRQKGGFWGVVFWEYIGEIAGGLTLMGAPPLAAWAGPGNKLGRLM